MENTFYLRRSVKGGLLYVEINGPKHIYRRRSQNVKGIIQLSCLMKGCNGGIAACVKSGHIHKRKPHTHEENLVFFQNMQLSARCKELAKTTSKPLRDIFAEQILRFPESTLTFRNIGSSMYRYRKERELNQGITEWDETQGGANDLHEISGNGENFVYNELHDEIASLISKEELKESHYGDSKSVISTNFEYMSDVSDAENADTGMTEKELWSKFLRRWATKHAVTHSALKDLLAFCSEVGIGVTTEPATLMSDQVTIKQEPDDSSDAAEIECDHNNDIQGCLINGHVAKDVTKSSKRKRKSDVISNFMNPNDDGCTEYSSTLSQAYSDLRQEFDALKCIVGCVQIDISTLHNRCMPFATVNEVHLPKHIQQLLQIGDNTAFEEFNVLMENKINFDCVKRYMQLLCIKDNITSSIGNIFHRFCTSHFITNITCLDITASNTSTSKAEGTLFWRCLLAALCESHQLNEIEVRQKIRDYH